MSTEACLSWSTEVPSTSAVGTPSVALFGPKDPRTYGPYNPHHRVVLKGDLGQGSMDAITVDDAFAAVKDLLAELSLV